MIAFPSLAITRQLLTWQALLDIALMAAALFFLYRFILRQGTWKVVAGVLLAAAVFLLSDLLNLQGISWIYRNVSQVAVLALIIIFQPELRKLFERAVSMRGAPVVDKADKLSRLMAETLWRLADERRGAIVVFPGREPLGEWLSGGNELHGVPSAALIMSIFDPHSPGHDGALVVERGSLTRFGVRLPVSRNGVLSDDYGTRHHAAMGLAERSDAMVVVVSEERGRVSVFQQGKMRSARKPDDISTAIHDHWLDTASLPLEVPGIGRRRLVGQVLASLAVAVFFWATLGVTEGELLEKVVTAPVEYTATPEHLVLVGAKGNEVRLHLAGPKSALDVATPSNVSVKIDLSKAVEGAQRFIITQESMRLPRGVSLLAAEPETLDLTLAPIVRRSIPVVAQLVGRLPDGLTLGSVEVRPANIAVLVPTGEASDGMPQITTTPVYLNGITGNTRLLCKIIAPASVQPVSKPWPDVEVIVTVTR